MVDKVRQQKYEFYFVNGKKNKGAGCHSRRGGTGLSATIFLPMLLLLRGQKGFPLLSLPDASPKIFT
jgi:hypothetical protein